MKRSKILTITFTFWILLIIMSVSWLTFLFYNNLYLLSTNIIFLLVLIVAIISFTLSIFFISQILVDVRIEIKEARQKEKNIRDLLEYNQILDPPSIYN
jgi:ABC-type siderophore export system fused ATPase/permease subunit